MSFEKHGQGYFNHRTLYQIDSLYAWKHGKYFPPVVVEINPTSFCNQRCRYCYVAGRTTGKLEPKAYLNLIPQLADTGVKAVVLQGTGEPLLHQVTPDFIAIGAQKGLSMSVTTNGVLLNKKIQDKILKHLVYIKFSNLEKDAKRYACYHGCTENQWELMIDNIKQAVATREQENLKVFFLATVYLFKENFHQAYEIVKFLKELGLDYISIQEAVPNEYSYSGKEPLASTFFSKEEIAEMKKQVLSLKDKDFFIKVRFPIDDNTFTNGMFKDCWVKNWCQGILFNTLINCDGEVYPCDRYWGVKEFSYGNIYEKNFGEIWKDPKRLKIFEYTNQTPPQGDECSTCNVTKINDILSNIQNANEWKDFLI